MAQKLNKSRMRDSRVIVLAVISIVFFTKALIGYKTALHESLEFLGYIMVAFCALGRVYTTAFLGGVKNKNLITYGPFSIVRNPLYAFSLMGVLGISLISGHIVIIFFVPVAFVVLYHFLIAREEEFLHEKFGVEYEAYVQSTPKLIPDFSKYSAPETIECVPQFLTKAFFDAVWWFMVFPLFELAESLQESGFFPVVFTMP
jgi:protein-S-isoprenylcysteine O-methyltransferase Ste14